ncbi:hypothetical protein IEQ34_010374 [Dendrobium chrysotoxum]|uniref:Uncharacterized protein n=1 Tax=Dendrobium chrysotoxum TaxID=161865 RepID=A0AAV7H4W1_DENCH|nr:hypothetical protein IEQ34_010374 [Dendrobium chrysotoxum]
MEDFLSFCGYCKSLGHSNLECSFLHPNHFVNSEKATNAIAPVVDDENPVDDVMHDTQTRPLLIASPTNNLGVIREDGVVDLGVNPIPSSSPSPILNDGAAADANTEKGDVIFARMRVLRTRVWASRRSRSELECWVFPAKSGWIGKNKSWHGGLPVSSQAILARSENGLARAILAAREKGRNFLRFLPIKEGHQR